MRMPWYQLSMLATESNRVIALRMMKIAAGGRGAKFETQRMVQRKDRRCDRSERDAHDRRKPHESRQALSQTCCCEFQTPFREVTSGNFEPPSCLTDSRGAAGIPSLALLRRTIFVHFDCAAQNIPRTSLSLTGTSPLNLERRVPSKEQYRDG